MSEKIKKILGPVSRLIIGGVLVYAGFLKISAPPEEFAYAIESYKIVSSGLALLIAQTLPWFEIYLGAILAAGVFVRVFSFFSFGLFAGFELFLLQAVIRKLPITNCGCFGASHSNGIFTEFSLNLIWLVFSAAAFFYGSFFSLDRLFEKEEK